MALIKLFFILVSVFVLTTECKTGEQFINSQLDDRRLYSGEDNLDFAAPRFLKKRLVKYDSYSSSSSSSHSNHVQTDPWPGRWFPDKVEEEPKKNSVVSRAHLDRLMGTDVDPECDDGKTKLFVDWSGSPENFTCFLDVFPPDIDTPAFLKHEYIPTEYQAMHKCMDQSIHYDSDLPTFGTHRPVYPRYGEYKFLPRQRWLHSLEHGAIVMLYHPCAHPLLVRQLKGIVKSCLFRHIITPYTLLSPARPLAILAWGWAMTMSMVDTEDVEKFIIAHALKGPEAIPHDGQYDYLLEHAADILTSEDDATVCPNRVLHKM